MKRLPTVLKVVLIAYGVLALACIDLSGGNNDSTVPAVDAEPCSDNHLSLREDGEMDLEVGTHQGDAFVAAVGDCNELQYFSGGGAQSATTFHIEPAVRVRSPDNRDADVTFSLRDPDTGDILDETAFEVFPTQWELDGDHIVFWDRVFIGPDLRGKNVVVHATVDFIDGGTHEAQSAFYLGEP